MLRWIAVASLLLLLAGPSAAAAVERTTLELDRMQGTEYPSEQKLKGETYTLASIYAAAGIVLDVDESDPDLAPVTGTDGEPVECITDAELDALAADHRTSPVPPGECDPGGERCLRSYAYGVVVAHFASNDFGECSTGVLGRMWDTTERSAFAIFYRNKTISTDGRKYLRTTAHELGHAFNLHHGDGDGEATIMNQTGVVGNRFTYDFSAHSEEHLGHHVRSCNRPGTGDFTAVEEQHAGWHGQVHAGCPSAASEEEPP